MAHELPRVVLVHGAWHGAWCWSALTPLLEAAGHEVSAVELPSAGDVGDLAADVAVVRAVIEQSNEPTIVVAHSYGGMPMTQASGVLPQVSHLVYLCSFMLDRGESLLGALDNELPPWIAVDADAGVSRVPDPVPVFYADVDPTEATSLAEQVSTQTLSSFGDELSEVAWRDVASTYVACTQDQAIPYPAQQAMSQRAGTVHTLDSSHSPFVSHADEVARIITAVTG